MIHFLQPEVLYEHIAHHRHPLSLLRRLQLSAALSALHGDRLVPKLKNLFLFTGNSCRSQMAEVFARHLKGDHLDAYSAGVDPHGMNPSAVKVMAEAGVDISSHHSKHV